MKTLIYTRNCLFFENRYFLSNTLHRIHTCVGNSDTHLLTSHIRTVYDYTLCFICIFWFCCMPFHELCIEKLVDTLKRVIYENLQNAVHSKIHAYWKNIYCGRLILYFCKIPNMQLRVHVAHFTIRSAFNTSDVLSLRGEWIYDHVVFLKI